MRRWQKAVLLVAVAAGLAFALLPYWIGAALPLLRRPLHLRVGSYERAGYSAFVLRDAAYQNGPVRVTAGWVRVDTPLLWALRHRQAHDRPALVRDWAVVVSRSAPTPPTGKPVGIVPLHALLQKIAAQLDRWLPRAELENGRVAWPAGGFRLARGEWSQRTFKATGLVWAAGSADLRIRFERNAGIVLEAQETDRAWRAALDWTGPTVSGTASAWNQPLTLRADYDPQGWLPRHGEAHAQGWNLPGSRAGVGQVYAALRGEADAEWLQGDYQLHVHATAAPARAALPPLRIDVDASGDSRGWSVGALQVVSAYAELRLNRPIRFSFGGPLDYRGAELNLRANLGRVPGLAASGLITGRIGLQGTGASLPTADFRLDAVDAGWRGFPRGEVSVSGSFDAASRAFSALTVHGQWSGAALRPVLPAGMTIGSLAMDALASGPLAALHHEGRLVITRAQVPPFRVGDVSANWRGEGIDQTAFQVHAALAQTRLDVGGEASRDGARITRLDFAPGGSDALRLAHPAQVRWSPAFACDALRLTGGGAEIAVDLQHLAFAFGITRIPAAWVTALVAWNGPNFIARTAGLTGRWEAGRLIFSAHADADLWLATGLARLTVAAEGDGRSLRIREARIESGGQVLASAGGEVPAWWAEEAPHLRFNQDAPLDLRVDTAADSPAWSALADTFGLHLQHPRAFLLAKGTLRQPRGEFQLRVGELATAPGRSGPPVPSLENLVLDLHADRGTVVLDRLAGRVAGRTVLASGRLPMTTGQWSALLARTPGRLWERAEATAEVGEAEMAPLAAYLPAILAPIGRWSARFHLLDGKVEGALFLHGLALRPIAPLGRVQNISGEIELRDRAIDISRLTAEIGGETVKLGGRVDLPSGGRPIFVLSLEGENIPLVRQAHLLVRSNLDLRVSTVGEDTRVTGKVAVSDALLLGDLADLLPSGLTGGSRPPPYFAVETPPLSHWHADVQLTADHTLRARTTLFSGDASAQFRIFGVLSDPRAVGQLRVDEGQISLPFATFDVQVGSVRLEPGDPFHPKVDVVATSRRFDFDLRMNASGTADSPVLTFTSNPALPSDQILQMVMAGQMPQNGSLLGAGQSQVTGLGEYVGQGLLAGLSGAPGSNRLSITSGQELSVKGKPTYEIEYRLAPRWWLVGEYDEFDAYNAGVRWRVYTKGGKP